MADFTIGGSDIGAIAGLSPYKTPLQVWLEMTGRVTGSVENDAMYWGRALEGPVADSYELRQYEAGNKCMAVTSGKITHPTVEWWRGTPDRICIGDCKWGLEIKTANVRQSHRWGEPGTDQIPDEYRAQVAWYQGLTGFDRWDVAVLIGGSDYREYSFRRDLELEEALREVGERFLVDYVRPDKHPPMDGSDAASQWLQKRFSRAKSDYLPSTEITDVLAMQLRDVQRDLKAASLRESELKNRLKELIGEAKGISGEWGRVTWGERRAGGQVDWEKVALEANVPADLILKHTSAPTITRCFRTTFNRE